MLKKTERLNRTDFNLCFAKGGRIHGLYTTVINYPSLEGFLCAVVVSKKVSKKAPVRNKIRRRVYGVVEKIKKDKNLKGSHIIVVKPEVNKLSAAAFTSLLGEEVGRLLN